MAYSSSNRARLRPVSSEQTMAASSKVRRTFLRALLEKPAMIASSDGVRSTTTVSSYVTVCSSSYRSGAGYVAAEDPGITFLRIHAKHPAPDLYELLQTVTYDETVVVDLTPPEEAIMAGFSKSARKKVRRTLEDAAMVCSDETGLSRARFNELYAIYRETADRVSFGIYDADVYFSMLESLGSAARVFVARRTDAGDDETPRTPGRAVAWIISTVFDGVGVDYFGGGNAESLATNAALRLKWHIFTTLKAEGVTPYDLMGVGSARAPQLMGVRQFKLQFADETTPVDGAWDVPVRGARYALLVRALGLKHALSGLLGRLRSR